MSSSKDDVLDAPYSMTNAVLPSKRVGFIMIVATALLGDWLFPGEEIAFLVNQNDFDLVRFAWVLASVLPAMLFDNPLWRLIVIVTTAVVSYVGMIQHGGQEIPPWSAVLSWMAWIVYIPHWKWLSSQYQPHRGIVVVTGADSGMGFATAVHLVQVGYHVVACCFVTDTSEAKLHEAVMQAVQDRRGDAWFQNKPDEYWKERLQCLSLDVTKDDSVRKAAETVEKHKMYATLGVVGVINCAGVGYSGPAEYLPLDIFQTQMNVNCFGYIRMAQAFLPLLKKQLTLKKPRRGRLVFFGTGGGTMTPTPPLLSAYMASKFAVEAYAGCLRMELQLTNVAIDCVMVNPGHVGPTNLQADGLKLQESLWKRCKECWGHDRAQQEYDRLLNKLNDFSVNSPMTHVSAVAKTVESILEAPRPKSSYKIGMDSTLAPFCGILPTGIREWLVKQNVFGEQGSV